MRRRALDHFYNLEYSEAIRLFEQLRDADRTNPAWQNQLATSYFYEILYRAGSLQGDLFGASNKFFTMKKIVPDPALVEGFKKANSEAIRLCEKRLELSKKDEASLYACGVAYAARASYQGIIEQSLFSTLGTARKANDYHSRLIEANPAFYDAYLVPGLYDFLLGSLPKAAKFLLFFGGFTGDRQRGLSKVETVSTSGVDARTDARIMLTVLYRREHRYADAIRAVSSLVDVYPRNYVFPLEIGALHRGAGEKDVAIQQYEHVLQLIQAGTPGFDRAPRARLHFEMGILYRDLGDSQAALTHLRAVTAQPDVKPELASEARKLIEQISASAPAAEGQKTAEAGQARLGAPAR